MNVRKIPLTLEVAFWNFVISTLTIVKEMRSYSQTSPATLPEIKKSDHFQSIKDKIFLIISNIKSYSADVTNIFIKLCVSAVLGFIIGLLLGILFGI